MYSEACELFKNKDCKSDCYWNFNGACTSEDLDEKDKLKEMTFDDKCPNYLHPDLEETADMRAYIRKNIQKIDKYGVETIYDFLYKVNEERKLNNNDK